MTRFPLFRSTAVVGEELVVAARFVVQRTGPPPPSERTRLELLVRDNIDVVLFVAGVSRLATHTTVSSGRPLYHMPRYNLARVLALEGLKKPNAKEPSSEMMVAPGKSELPGTSRSSDALNGRKTRPRVTTQQATDDQSMGLCQYST